jgi:hypothetical protein
LKADAQHLVRLSQDFERRRVVALSLFFRSALMIRPRPRWAID